MTAGERKEFALKHVKLDAITEVSAELQATLEKIDARPR